VVLNSALAQALQAKVGDDVLVRLGRPQEVPTDALLGRRDKTALSIRVTVDSIVPAEGLGAFAIESGQRTPLNAYLPRELLQRALDKIGRCNALLLAATPSDADASSGIRAHVALDDYGLSLRIDAARRTLSLEDESFLLDSHAAATALAVGKDAGLRAERLSTYLANRIRITGREETIPYSTVTALGPDSPSLALMSFRGGATESLHRGEILLNSWAADQLNASVGDEITVSYYVTGEFGALREEDAKFKLVGVVELSGAADDPGFTPQYRGVTDAPTMAAWDPPFPVDLKLIRPIDEEYWQQHRTTPKAFVSYEDGMRLWHQSGDAGDATSIRLHVPADAGDINTPADAFKAEFLRRLTPDTMGLSLRPVRAEALAASGGATDFGGLFVGFSFFLIASAALLVALLFSLGIERRSSELGALLAIGFTSRRVMAVLFVEALVVATAGSVVGLLAARGYAWLMLAGLRSWWSAAVAAPRLVLDATARSYAIGGLASVALALFAVAWGVRRSARTAPRALLAGQPLSDNAQRAGFTSMATPIAMVAFVGAAALLVLATAERIAAASGFFGAGATMLIGGLAIASRLLQPHRPHTARPPGAGRADTMPNEMDARPTVIQLGLRNAPRHKGRSRLTIGLLASACFLIVALQAFRRDVTDSPANLHSGTGGFTLFAESVAPVVYDLNTPAGREQSGAAQPDDEAFNGMRIFPFRLRGGEAASCNNLYSAREPRILGATAAFVERGGFEFADTAAATPENRNNPWRLLEQPLEDGAIPAIGDEAAVRWQLHSGLGRDLVVHDAAGAPVRLRFVALLAGSPLQDEIIIGEQSFRRLFPNIGGYGFFLIESPQPDKLSPVLERNLRGFGFDAAPLAERLQSYLVVQNTYLSTFQTLGGLGLVLGAVGLAAVMLRNVYERRSELALLRAVGFSNQAVTTIVLAENAVLILAGLLIGVVAAFVAILPQIGRTGAHMAWLSWAAMLGAVLLAGLGVGAAAVASALRQPLLASLRRE
jgi:ABC-type antimicrobial peptide transport system permease subunit